MARARRSRPALQITPVIDRFYFRSVYFREPGGILYELATIGPGFTTDEPLETLGERLALPPDFEHLREQVEPLLTPLPDVRQWRPAPVAEHGAVGEHDQRERGAGDEPARRAGRPAR